MAWWRVGLLVALVFGGGGYLLVQNRDLEAASAFISQHAAPDQLRFLATVEKWRVAYRAAENDMRRGATRPERAAELCQAKIDPLVVGWVGRVDALSSNADGHGVLSVDIGGAVLSTWNNSFSDIRHQTLIQHGSPLFASAAELRPGQMVQVWGELIPQASDCFAEMSLSVSGAMTAPRFVTRFTIIRGL